MIGSACSLLTLMIKESEGLLSLDHFQQGEANFAYLLGAPIMLDSSNFSESLKDNKWSHEDIEAHQWLN